MIELTCVLLYIYPAHGVFGAVLMMGLSRRGHGDPGPRRQSLFRFTLFSLYLGLIMWGGLWLRDPALRTLFPFRRAAPAL
jgi:hypothetical protein